MKKNLKSIFALFSICLGSLLVSCGGNSNSTSGTCGADAVEIEEEVVIPLTSDGYQWKVATLKGNEVVAQEQGPSMFFDTIQSTIGGNAGCNIFNANYVIDSVSANSITITPLQVTMMACPDLQIEQVFLEVLPQIVEYKLSIVDSIPTLSFFGKDGVSLMTLKQAPKAE
ncbi:MAG: META domain-containing protein [Paludibacteraceae bacterium]|jgi:heat shock protein HslJ|nr:META domain-containing protein [Paludibacteraceae bacterium]MEE0912467.1 META domain-containing protein [Paludibacteraceae bacterium]